MTKYEVLVDKEKADMAEAIRQSSDDSLRGLQRPGSDGTVALSTSSDPARLIEAGTMAWADLAPNRGSPCRPSSTVVEGVCWIEGAPGLFVFPPDFSGEVATEVATPETVLELELEFIVLKRMYKGTRWHAYISLRSKLKCLHDYTIPTQIKRPGHPFP